MGFSFASGVVSVLKLSRPDMSRFAPANWSRRERRWVIVGASAILGLVAAWFLLMLAMTNPRFATPVVNWGLGAFADDEAKVRSARLRHVFSSTFDIDAMNWPGRLTAEEINIRVDFLGWLPARRWTRHIWLRDGDFTLADTGDSSTPFNPHKYVDRVDIRNLDIRFTRKERERVITIETASGSFAAGSVKAEAAAGRNRLSFDGLARAGFSGDLTGQVTAKGENIAELAEFVGASAPDTPPFDLTGKLAMATRNWTVSGLNGTMGDSDISGRVRIDLRQDKPFLDVALASSELDFDDMGVVFGLPTRIGENETTNEEQREAQAAYNASSRLIPDAEIDFSRLAAINGDFIFEATKIVDAPAGLSALVLEGALRDSVMEFTRVSLASGSGQLEGQVKIDATQDPAHTHAQGVLKDAPIATLLGSQMVRGDLQGRFELDLVGSDFRSAFGSSNGTAGVWSANSELAKIATEGAGLDLGEILLLLAEQDEVEYLQSRCFAASVKVTDGLARIEPAVIDNKDSLVTAEGDVNLKNERMAIKVDAHPKDVSIGTIFGDIKVGGTLRNPELDYLSGDILLQTGIAAALASIAGPLAAIPFLELGGGEDANCAELLAGARQQGPGGRG